ncbi:hypothetical protein NAF17_09010 [Mucilaginibacter sp. RB4R14]|uniref:hypothetical protein n=1 Tax=Mucilaginibacter aurantiaciroseus TaxID=2949308 RepID=UPI0020909507|nr:hypothetical protein [Mucilaginibacter aurantiaciroseus]MCO5935680.1 hypothetical protein [Mucilaginibacter aurantiaciroseus]
MKLILLSFCFLMNSFTLTELPIWFIKSFNNKKLNERYAIINPKFLEADFNGDKIQDIAVQVIDKRSKKKGILIINGGTNKHCIFGAGFKFAGDDFNDTNWLDGWRLYKAKVAYETTFNADGDIKGSRKVKISHPAISIYSLQDGSEIAGALIYWDGKNYVSIHQGE